MLIAVIALSSCSNERVTDEYSFQLSLLEALMNDHEHFESLGIVAEQSLTEINEEVFSALSQLSNSSPSMGFRTYQLVTFGDNQKVLIQLTREEGKEGFVISDIIFVPEEMNVLFEQLKG